MYCCTLISNKLVDSHKKKQRENEIKKTRGPQEPVSLTLVYVHTKQWTQIN